MKPIKTQFGTSSDADFSEGTWTFLMPNKFEVRAGKFALEDKEDWDKRIALMKEIDKYLSDNPKNYMGSGSILHTKIKEALAGF